MTEAPAEQSDVRLVVATANTHKVQEIRDILITLIPGLDPATIVDQSRYPIPPIREDGATFQENAALKAEAVAAATGLPALADDSGLIADVMGAAPGILSARWAGKHGADKDSYELLLAQLADLPDHLRGARFVCDAALAVPGAPVRHGEGVVVGTLVREPRGSHGFGYDPIFQPEGWTKTTAQVPAAEKNLVSHRGRALKALLPDLLPLFAQGGYST